MLLFAIRRNLNQFSPSNFPSQSVTGVGDFLWRSSSEKVLLVIHFRQVRTRVGIRRVSRARNLCLLFPNDSHTYAATQRKQLKHLPDDVFFRLSTSLFLQPSLPSLPISFLEFCFLQQLLCC